MNTGTFEKTAGIGSANPTDVGVPLDNDGTLIGSTAVPAGITFSAVRGGTS